MKVISLFLFLISTCLYSQERKNRIVNDQFVQHLFVDELSPANIRKHVTGKVILEMKTQKNKYTSDLDTLLTFKSENCEFTFLKTACKIMFSHAIIRSSCIKLSNGIEIGFLKRNFLKFIPEAKNVTSDPIVITDTAEFWNDSFYFKDGKLIKIILFSRID